MDIETNGEGVGVNSPELTASEVALRLEVPATVINIQMGPFGGMPCHKPGRVWLTHLVGWLRTLGGVRLFHPKAELIKTDDGLAWVEDGQVVEPWKLCAARPGSVCKPCPEILSTVQELVEAGQYPQHRGNDDRVTRLAYDFDRLIPYGYEGVERTAWVRAWGGLGANPETAMALEHQGLTPDVVCGAQVTMGDIHMTVVEAIQHGTLTAERAAELITPGIGHQSVPIKSAIDSSEGPLH